MEKLIGLVPPGKIGEDPCPRRDEYFFGNNYCNRITDKGGIPLGILPSDCLASEKLLEKCDGFLILGGSKFWPYHMQVIHHAVTTGKPLLGICLGMQAICQYFRNLDCREANGLTGDIRESFVEVCSRTDKLYRVEGHHMAHVRGGEDATKQAVILTPGSHIHRLTGQDVIYGGSFHRYAMSDVSPRLTVTGRSEDGTIDVVEYGEKILGVQFHPEIDRKLHGIFDILFQEN